MLGFLLNAAVGIAAVSLIPQGGGDEAPTKRINPIDPEMPSRVDDGNKRIQDRLMQNMLARAAEIFDPVKEVSEREKREKREQKKRRRLKALQAKAQPKEIKKNKAKGRLFLKTLSHTEE